MAIARRSSISYPRRWNPTQVPTFPVEIDTTKSLGQSVSYFHLPGVSPAPLLLKRGGLSLGYQNGAVAKPGAAGAGMGGSAGFLGQSSTAQYAGNTYGVNQSQGTILFYVTAGWAPGSQPSTEAALFEIIAAGPAAPALGLQVYNSSFYAGWYNGSDTRYTASAAGAWAAGDTFTLGFSWNYNATTPANSTTSVFVKGKTWGTRTGSFTSFNTGAGLYSFDIGNSTQNLLNNWIGSGGAIYAVASFDAALGPSDIAQFNSEPFAMLRPQVRRQYYFGATSVGFTASPTPGLLTFAGFAPSVSAGATLSPSPGLIGIAGAAPSVSAGATLSPAAGLLSITGYTPSISAGGIFAPQPGVLSLTGSITSISAGVAASPSPALLSLTGYTASISTGFAASPGAGSIILTGGLPTVTYGGSGYPPFTPSSQRTTYSAGAARIVISTPASRFVSSKPASRTTGSPS